MTHKPRPGWVSPLKKSKEVVEEIDREYRLYEYSTDVREQVKARVAAILDLVLRECLSELKDAAIWIRHYGGGPENPIVTQASGKAHRFIDKLEHGEGSGYVED